MSSTDLYIIAAGNGSRTGLAVPKALISIAGEPCITTTLQQIGHKFRKVFVVTNHLVDDQWEAYFRGLERDYPELAKMTMNLPIASGLGDGHATLQGLRAAARLESVLSRDIVVAWGDAFFSDSEIVDELLTSVLQGSGMVPAVYESSPYVCLQVDKQMRCKSACFSKYGEAQATGLHDQSLFRFDIDRLSRSLEHLHNALWRNDHYMAPGGELSLLYSFHQLYNSGEPVYAYETSHSTLSFNTVEEISYIQREISASWKRRVRSNHFAPADTSKNTP